MDQRLTVILQRIDTRTNQLGDLIGGVSTRIDNLISKITTSMTQAEVDEVVNQLSSDADQLDTAATALQNLASDPNNPVPIDAATPQPVENPPNPVTEPGAATNPPANT